MIANLGSKMISNRLTLHLVLMITLIIVPSEQQQQLGLARQTIYSYCKSFSNCQDCMRSIDKCEWCHSIGCTNNAGVYCPKKAFPQKGRICTEVVTKSPLFVPTNVKRFINLELLVGDTTLYKQKIICELHLEGHVYHFSGSFDKTALYCDTPILTSKSNVAVGYLKLLWGGAEATSNVVLVIVYSCKRLANTCRDCHNLNTELSCGWCKDTMSCSLIEECPRKSASWVTRNWTCGSENSYSRYHGRNVRKYVDKKLRNPRSSTELEVFN